MQELAREAAARGALVLYGASDAAVSTPYQPLREWLEFLLRNCDADTLEKCLAGSAVLARLGPELAELIGRFEPVAPAPDDCGAHDWSDLQQRMHYIVHLFRAWHENPDLSRPPFTSEQLDRIGAGVIPEGEL